MSLDYSNLSKKITKSIDKNIKKKEGIYFTPPKTIDNIIKIFNEYYNNNIKTVLEPSCGSCEFITIFDQLYNLDFTCIENNLTIYNNIKDIQKNNISIINTDFITYKNNNKYDLIIGNPPYFVVDKSKISKEYYNYFEGRPNIFIIFIIKSLKLLNKDGYLIFVLPKSFNNSLYYNKTRQYINDNFTIINICNCNDDNYLETKQETISIFIKNKKPTETNEYSFKINDNIIFASKEDIENIKQLYNNSTTLKNLDFNITVGNIVWNQVKNLLTNDNNKTRLIYSSDIEKGKLVQKKYKNTEKKNYIDKKGTNNIILVINRGYGVGKYNFNYAIINDKKEYLIENHLLVVKYNKSHEITDEELLKKYDKIINSFQNIKTSKFIDIYFGNNAINSNELLNILPIYDYH
tara:strand:+ start:488 stop:1705 length:1218 start_codon:yes stop_codon:yes gene_type:complete